jgi:hypothetical protein
MPFASARRRVLVLALAAIPLLGACSDPNEVEADKEVVGDTLFAYALNGTAAALPTAFYAAARQVVRADGAFDYDLVFDIDPQGRAVVMPLKVVAGIFSPRVVAVQRLSVPYDELGRAPSTGYYDDSTFVLTPGDGLVMAANAPACQFSFVSQNLYTKLVIDSVNTGARIVFFRTTHDPNCGFRSFEPGIPKN